MKIIKISKNGFTKEEVDFIASELKKGKVVVLPTDTVYGFSCLASSVKAVRKIRQIKKRNAKKSFLLLLKSYCQLHDFCRVSAKQDKFLRTVWPPTTRALQDSKYVFKKNRQQSFWSLKINYPMYWKIKTRVSQSVCRKINFFWQF